jgi:hypothetical protein
MDSHLRNSLILREEGSGLVLDVLGIAKQQQPITGLPATRGPSASDTVRTPQSINGDTMYTLKLNLPDDLLTETYISGGEDVTRITFFRRASCFTEGEVHVKAVQDEINSTTTSDIDGSPTITTLSKHGGLHRSPTGLSDKKVRFSSLMKFIPKTEHRCCSASSALSNADLEQVRIIRYPASTVDVNNECSLQSPESSQRQQPPRTADMLDIFWQTLFPPRMKRRMDWAVDQTGQVASWIGERCVEMYLSISSRH